jgi:hypothetical protein
VLVPFTTPYRPFWTGLGILAGYLAAGLSLTYYVRHRIGSKRWRPTVLAPEPPASPRFDRDEAPAPLWSRR